MSEFEVRRAYINLTGPGPPTCISCPRLARRRRAPRAPPSPGTGLPPADLKVGASYLRTGACRVRNEIRVRPGLLRQAGAGGEGRLDPNWGAAVRRPYWDFMAGIYPLSVQGTVVRGAARAPQLAPDVACPDTPSCPTGNGDVHAGFYTRRDVHEARGQRPKAPPDPGKPAPSLPAGPRLEGLRPPRRSTIHETPPSPRPPASAWRPTSTFRRPAGPTSAPSTCAPRTGPSRASPPDLENPRRWMVCLVHAATGGRLEGLFRYDHDSPTNGGATGSSA
jgi:hypothetical protein